MSINQKFDGNVTVTGSLLKGDGTPFNATFELIGSGKITPWDEDIVHHMQLTILKSTQVDYSKYSLFLFTAMGSAFIFLSSPVLNTENGLKACCSMIHNYAGSTTIVKAKLYQTGYDGEAEGYFINTVLVPSNPNTTYFDFNSPYPDGYLYGIKL